MMTHAVALYPYTQIPMNTRQSHRLLIDSLVAVTCFDSY